MSAIFLKILNLGINASWLIAAVIVLRVFLKKAPKWLNCALWAVVAFRLLCPISLETALSLLPSSEVIPQDIATEQTPMIHTQIAIVDNTVNPVMARNLSPRVEESVNPMQIIISAASMIWAAGAGICVLYGLISYLLLRRKVRASLQTGNGVMICDEITTPFVLGIIRPTIYVPSFLEGQKLEVVLAHERAHIARHDHWWKPLGFALLSVYWFHPLCWIAYILLCRDIEAACDERVIRDRDGEYAAVYSQALLDLSLPRHMITVCPLAFGETGVKGRVKSVLNYRKPSFWIITVGIFAGIVLAVCFATNPKATNAKANPLEGKQSQAETDTKGRQDGMESVGKELTKEEALQLIKEGKAMVFPEERLYLYSLNDQSGEVANGRYPICFSIHFSPDGTDNWYETPVSSYMGMGHYCVNGDEVIIVDDQSAVGQENCRIHRFKLDGDRLVFVEKGSDNFDWIKLKDGEEFILDQSPVAGTEDGNMLSGIVEGKEASSATTEDANASLEIMDTSLEDSAAVSLIYEFVDAVNARDLDRYISLFDEENQKEMRQFVKANGEESLFAETSRSILKIEKNLVPPYEKEEGRFEDAVSYRVTESVQFGDDAPTNTYELISGETVHDYVIVKEKGEWKLYRISAVPE